ncbi:hypothetical protein CEP54_000134 [Fusarium duplospermum]|uniref:2EXR domain-containing protein n=1 Tax=Fusarium duplospermum TaxID=1325734 RepID=A0A428R884_9HYPO|nr:hypothetical protein CEP54_000134 [Fusarium duplospermum]
MVRKFHRFPDLPWELRDMIWNFALRPNIPGVHVFKLYNKTTDHGVDRNVDVFDQHGSLRLAAPQNNKTSITRNRDNPSTYLIDGGLWTACKESNLVMKRNFNHQKWKSLLKDTNHSPSELIEKGMDMPQTSYFTHHNGRQYFFTVLPHKDLFIFQPQNLWTIDWFEFCRGGRLGSPVRGFAGIRNIALEFNLKWAGDIEERIIHMVKDTSDVIPGVNIWMIDYTLRRRDSAAVGQQSTSRGHESVAFRFKGQQLIPVDLSRKEDWIEVEEVNGKYVEKPSAVWWRNSIDFVNTVREELFLDRDFTFEEIRPRAVSVGLLAYVSGFHSSTSIFWLSYPVEGRASTVTKNTFVKPHNSVKGSMAVDNGPSPAAILVYLLPIITFTG